MVYTVLIIGCGLLGSIIISRILGKVSRGEVAAIFLYPALMIYIASFGTYSAAVYYSSRKTNNIRYLAGSCLMVLAINSIIGYAIGYILIAVGLDSQHNDILLYSVLLLSLLPLNMANQFIVSFLQARKLFNLYNILRIILPVAYLIILVSLWFSDLLSVRTVIAAQGAVIILQFVIAIYCFHTRVISILQLRFKWRISKLLYKYGLQVWLGDLSQGLNSKLDQILIAAFLLPADLGIYVVAVSVANFSTVLSNAFKTIYLPILSGTRHLKEKFVIVKTALVNFSGLNLLGIVFSILVAPYIIPFIYGEEFEKSGLIAQILFFGYFFFNLKIVVAAMMQGLGKPIFVSYAEIGGMVITVISTLLLIWNYELVGASIAVSLGYLTQASLITFYIWRLKKNVV